MFNTDHFQDNVNEDTTTLKTVVVVMWMLMTHDLPFGVEVAAADRFNGDDDDDKEDNDTDVTVAFVVGTDTFLCAAFRRPAHARSELSYRQPWTT